MDLKVASVLSSAAGVCRHLLTSASTTANSLDPDQTAHIGTV